MGGGRADARSGSAGLTGGRIIPGTGLPSGWAGLVSAARVDPVEGGADGWGGRGGKSDRWVIGPVTGGGCPAPGSVVCTIAAEFAGAAGGASGAAGCAAAFAGHGAMAARGAEKA
ncbi:hypothetical protein [Tabrizicola sp. TH137]|uniref:hypothetical protein n=1 Tax=Tabrizicola sp. TH137 TaxID=2067452 RepID=UPI00130477C1|nr:hypothetical protein [Tabrizicola sp. TH137]